MQIDDRATAAFDVQFGVRARDALVRIGEDDLVIRRAADPDDAFVQLHDALGAVVAANHQSVHHGHLSSSVAARRRATSVFNAFARPFAGATMADEPVSASRLPSARSARSASRAFTARAAAGTVERGEGDAAPKPGSDATSVDAIGTAVGAGVAGGAAGCGDTGATTGEAGAG